MAATAAPTLAWVPSPECNNHGEFNPTTHACHCSIWFLGRHCTDSYEEAVGYTAWFIFIAVVAFIHAGVVSIIVINIFRRWCCMVKKQPACSDFNFRDGACVLAGLTSLVRLIWVVGEYSQCVHPGILSIGIDIVIAAACDDVVTLRSQWNARHLLPAYGGRPPPAIATVLPVGIAPIGVPCVVGCQQKPGQLPRTPEGEEVPATAPLAPSPVAVVAPFFLASAEARNCNIRVAVHGVHLPGGSGGPECGGTGDRIR